MKEEEPVNIQVFMTMRDVRVQSQGTMIFRI